MAPLSAQTSSQGRNDKEAFAVSNGHELDRAWRSEIRLGGTLEPQWSGWFDGFEITPQPGGETVLAGEVPDQAALHGVLFKIRDLGLPLLRLKRLEARNLCSDSGSQDQCQCERRERPT